MVKPVSKIHHVRSTLSRSNNNTSITDVFFSSSTLYPVEMNTFHTSYTSIFLHLLILVALSSLWIVPFFLKGVYTFVNIAEITIKLMIGYFVFYTVLAWATTYLLCYVSDKQPGINTFHIVLGCYTYVPLYLFLSELLNVLGIVAFYAITMVSDYYAQINFLNSQSTSPRTRILILIIALTNIVLVLFGSKSLGSMILDFATK